MSYAIRRSSDARDVFDARVPLEWQFVNQHASNKAIATIVPTLQA
jgi:hypothetical protein